MVRSYREEEVVLLQSQPFTPAQALEVLRSRAPLIALCALIVAFSAFGFSQLQTKRYSATAVLHFNQQPPSPAQVAALSRGARAVPQSSRSNAQLVLLSRTSGAELGPASLVKGLNIATGSNFRLVEVTATTTSPKLAARFANSYAHRYADYQDGLNERRIAIGLDRLRSLSAGKAAEAGPRLIADRQTLRAILRSGYGDVTVAEPAMAPSNASYPDVTRDALKGLAIGTLLGAGLALAVALYEEREGRGDLTGARRTMGDSNERAARA
jgi:uncharacterized protein involved in exopolysaccharide biosynthesis